MRRVYRVQDQAERERMSKESARLSQTHSPENGDDASPDQRPDPPTPMSQQPRRRPLNPTDADPHLVTLLAPESLEAEHYRGLGHRIAQMNKNSSLQVMAISSPTMGDGKSTTVLNLAGTLAQMPDMHVLVIDMDLRRPKLPSYLGFPSTRQVGLVDAILNPGLSLLDIVTVCEPYTLSLLSAGRVTPSSYELLQSPRVGELLEEGRKSYDFIIIDTPPLIPLADCLFIEKWIDGLLLIVGAHKTPRELVGEALAVVGRSKVVGLIFNRDERIMRGYYSYSYSNYTSSKE